MSEVIESNIAGEKPRRRVRWIFVGPHGLRAGWGIACWLLLWTLAMAAMVGAFILAGIHSKDLMPAAEVLTPRSTAFMVGMPMVGMLVATVLMALIERRGLSAYGLNGRRWAVRLLQGVATGLATMALLAGALYALGGLAFDGVALHGAEAWRMGLAWAGVFALVGISEEVMFRGYLFQTLSRGLNAGWATVITSIVFMAAHLGNAGEGVVGIAAVFLVGLVFCLSIWRTGTLWWAIGFHAAWDWMQSYVLGVGNSGAQVKGSLIASHATGPAWLSGGDTGPEGSVLILAILAITAGLILLTVRGRDHTIGHAP